MAPREVIFHWAVKWFRHKPICSVCSLRRLFQPHHVISETFLNWWFVFFMFWILSSCISWYYHIVRSVVSFRSKFLALLWFIGSFVWITRRVTFIPTLSLLRLAVLSFTITVTVWVFTGVRRKVMFFFSFTFFGGRWAQFTVYFRLFMPFVLFAFLWFLLLLFPFRLPKVTNIRKYSAAIWTQCLQIYATSGPYCTYFFFLCFLFLGLSESDDSDSELLNSSGCISLYPAWPHLQWIILKCTRVTDSVEYL